MIDIDDGVHDGAESFGGRREAQEWGNDGEGKRRGIEEDAFGCVGSLLEIFRQERRNDVFCGVREWGASRRNEDQFLRQFRVFESKHDGEGAAQRVSEDDILLFRVEFLGEQVADAVIGVDAIEG